MIGFTAQATSSALRNYNDEKRGARALGLKNVERRTKNVERRTPNVERRTPNDLIIHRVRLVLASSSPRRAELLAAAGYTFTVSAVAVDERVRPGEVAADYVRRLASEKSACALELLKGLPQTAILGAANASEKVATHTVGHEIVKEIVVPGKLVNLVVR